MPKGKPNDEKGKQGVNNSSDKPQDATNLNSGSTPTQASKAQDLGVPTQDADAQDQANGPPFQVESTQATDSPAAANLDDEESDSEDTASSSAKPHNFYDKLLTCFIYLSKEAQIKFINALFGYDFPLDSDIEYLLTKSVDLRFNERFSDLILKIMREFYFHIELELKKKKQSMSKRIHRYESASGDINAHFVGDSMVFPYPESVVIYLTPSDEVGPVFKQTITINEKHAMQYEVPVIKLTELSVDEIVDKGLTFLLPLYMVKHRHKVANYMKSLTDPNIKVKAGTKEKLQKLVYVDIIEGIEKGYSLGSIMTLIKYTSSA
jgi:hypothetical protein